MPWDVVVVGAGVAGLAAAGELARAGKKILLLEARSRLGGRVHTIIDPAYNHPVELGAEFLEGDLEQLRDLALEADLKFHQLDEPHRLPRPGDTRPSLDVNELVDRLLALAGAPLPDVPVAQLIREQAGQFTADELDAMTMYLEGFHGADLTRFGSRALAENEAAEDTDRARMRRVVGGYGELVEHLVSRLDTARVEVRRSSPVSRLRWRPGWVELTVRKDEDTELISAPQAVLTLPVGVLRQGGVEIEPMPADWERALATLETGLAQRLDFRFERPWWIEQDEPLSGFIFGSTEPFRVWWTTSPPDLPYLTGWVGGPRAEPLAGLSREERVRLGLESLSSIFGYSTKELSRWLQADYAYDWTTDPYSRGAYSYGRVGATAARETLRRPAAATLFLSGEALATGGRNATVPGALSSGLRTAAEVLKTRI